MTAQHAEFEGFAALAPQTFDAGITLNGMAVSAMMRDFRLSMTGTKHFAAGQHHGRRGRHGTFDFRDRDFHFSGINDQLHIA